MNNLYEYYFFVEDMEAYVENSEIGKNRLEKFKKVYYENREFFGEKILDLCCGGGLISNFLAREGHKVIGVDYLQELLDKAEENKPHKDNPKYIQADLNKYEISENYDTVIMWGNSIAHFSPQSLSQLFKKVRNRTKYLILEYADFISFGFTGNLKEFMVEKGTYGDPVLDVYGGYDGINSGMLKYAFIPSKGKVFEFIVYLHNPGSVSGILQALDYSLIKREIIERFFGSRAPNYLDIWTTSK